jgi:hypothetical protein
MSYYINNSDSESELEEYQTDNDTDDEKTVDEKKIEDILKKYPIDLLHDYPSEDFCNYITKKKYELFEKIIVKDENIELNEEEDHEVEEDYIKISDILAQSIINIINNPLVMDDELKKYVNENIRDLVNDIFNYIQSFVLKNTNINKMIYEFYIVNQFRIYPFIQLPYLPVY